MAEADREFDIIIIGAGIAGASAGYFLSGKHKVCLLEREPQPGYHTTGRSAAVYTRAYGNRVIRALTAASEDFLMQPPKGFCDHPILSRRGALFVGSAEQAGQLDAAFEEAFRTVKSVQRLDQAQTLDLVPALRREHVAGGVLEPEAKDIDVAALHQGFLRGVRSQGGQVAVNAGVEALDHAGGKWQVTTRSGVFAAPIVVNAAGAWCDEIAQAAGVNPIGLQPKIRTVIVFDAPSGMAIDDWPLTIGVAEDFYFKPEAGRFLGSLADETPSGPCDVLPEDLAVATAADRIQTVANLPITHIRQKWAGLRSFVEDRTPVVGFDVAADGFFWLAGQGGYGIQTSPAMGMVAAALILGDKLPDGIAATGVRSADLSPARLTQGDCDA